MAITNLLSGLGGGGLGRLVTFFSDIGRSTMVGPDATENFTPLDWPRKVSARQKFG